MTNIMRTWNRIKWIKNNNSSGFLNQKRSFRGFNFAPAKNPVMPAFSNAKVAITCCSFVPTRRTSCIEHKAHAHHNMREAN